MKSAAALATAVAVAALVALSVAAPDDPSEGYEITEPEREVAGHFGNCGPGGRALTPPLLRSPAEVALLRVFDQMTSAYGHGYLWVHKHPDHCQWKGVGCDAARRVVSV